MTGRTIAHYEILERLGEGGMGLVYKARDTHLDRFVAIKVLPPQTMADPERKRRFVQEAKAASALNHPNIITIYDISQADGIDFIAMEYVAGKTLDGLIPRHGMRLHEVLDCAVQIADALARAHSAGIIHRDLKPSNIMVDEHGVVKILDFGLAKLTEVTSSGKDAATRTMRPVTEEGKIVGTVAYMSPEQARAEELDARSDLFSFGVVLYEMTTGQRPFQGDSAAVLFSAILEREPVPPAQLNPQIPAKLVEIINKALEKDPDVRYQHAADMRADLKRLKRDTESGRATSVEVAAPARRAARGQQWIWVGVAAVILAAAAAFWLTREVPPPRVLGATQISRDGHQKVSPFNVQSLWTDGSRLYFNEEVNGSWHIAQVSAMGGETLPFPTSIATPLLVSMAPNRSELLVQSLASNDPIAPLWLTPAVGGMPRRLGDIRSNDGVFSPDGRHIVYAKGPEIYQANLDGTESRKLLTVATNALFPRFSPDGSILRFTLIDSKTASRSIWEARSDGTGLRPILPDWNRPHNEACGSWTPDGRFYIFEAVREGTTTSNLWALRERAGLFGKPNGVPTQLTAGPLDYHMPVPSPDGHKLYVIGVQQRAELVSYDVRSKQFRPFLSAIWAEQLDFSRDGRWVTYVLYPEGTLWRSKLDGTERLQLTFPPMQVLMPRWSPDAKRIAFSAGTRGELFKIYSVAAEGGAPEQLTTGERADFDPSWAADGESLVFGRNLVAESGKPSALAIQVLQLRARQVSILPGSEGLWYASYSPDGRHISALTANSQAIMLFNTATQKWSELVRTVVNSPVWSLDSQYIYFDSYPTRDAAVFRVRIRDQKLERVGNFEGFRRAESAVLKWPWLGVAPDGSPLLVRDIGTQEIYALDWQAP